MALAETTRNTRGPWQWHMARESSMVSIPVILWTLHELGGEITDEGGHCGALVLEEAGKRGWYVHPTHQPGQRSGGYSQLLQELETGRYGGCISRDINGKRTYAIRLNLSEAEMPRKPQPVVTKKVEPTKPVPRDVAEALVKPRIGDTRPAPVAPTPPPAPTPTPRPMAAQDKAPSPTLAVATDTPTPTTVEPTIPPMLAITGNLADVLTQIQQLSFQAWMLSVTGTETAPPVSDEQAVRLAETLEENNRLRRKCNDQSETLRATLKERDGLRQQIMLLQNNLRVVQEASNGSGNLERKLNRFNGTQKAIASRPEPAIAGRR